MQYFMLQELKVAHQFCTSGPSSYPPACQSRERVSGLRGLLQGQRLVPPVRSPLKPGRQQPMGHLQAEQQRLCLLVVETSINAGWKERPSAQS